jgi:hypothetical protein
MKSLSGGDILRIIIIEDETPPEMAGLVRRLSIDELKERQRIEKIKELSSDLVDLLQERK